MEVKISAVFCEDIRQEIDGRHMLLGVYPGIIFVSRNDSVLVSHHIQITGLDVGSYTSSMRVIHEANGATRTLSSIDFDVQVESHYPVILTPMGMTVDSRYGDGLLKLFVTIDDQPEVEVESVVIEVVDDDDADGATK